MFVLKSTYDALKRQLDDLKVDNEKALNELEGLTKRNGELEAWGFGLDRQLLSVTRQLNESTVAGKTAAEWKAEYDSVIEQQKATEVISRIEINTQEDAVSPGLIADATKVEIDSAKAAVKKPRRPRKSPLL